MKTQAGGGRYISFNAQKNGTVDEFGEYDSFGQGASFYIYIENRA